jgi:hypothetical protein
MTRFGIKLKKMENNKLRLYKGNRNRQKNTLFTMYNIFESIFLNQKNVILRFFLFTGYGRSLPVHRQQIMPVAVT